MSRKVRLSIFAFAMFTISQSTQGQDAGQRLSEVTVTGRGEVHVVPDRAVLAADVVNNASSATTAASENARIVVQVIQRLRATGAADTQITNGGYSLGQDFENGDRRKPRGFTARNTIRVEVAQVSNIGRMIDAALAGGATDISSIQFVGPDMPGARAEALRKAVQDARRDAAILAEAAGGSLGKLISLSSGPAQPGYAQFAIAEATSLSSREVGVPTSIRPNDVVVSAFANAKWEFIPRR